MESLLTIGELSARSGVAVSALRFYEDKGLLSATRTSGGQRRYPRSALRRVAVVRAAQRVGLSLAEIRSALPPEAAVTRAGWTAMSRSWRPVLDARISALQALRDQLDSCIGCGCLSLRRCALYNPGDVKAASGSGSVLDGGPGRPVR